MKKGSIFCLIGLTLLFTISLSACHVGRFFVYNFADHTDYKKFPNRTITAPESSFFFKRSAKPVNIAMKSGKYDSFEMLLKKNKSLSFLVIKNDTIIYEWYAEKSDSSSIFTSFSMAKSYVGLLVGIAIEEGKIKGVNEPITTYISEFKNPGFEKITIQHLLNMQSGIAFNESYYNPFGHMAKFYYGRKLLKYIRRLEIEKSPGSGFDYKSLDTQLLGIILERATGKKLANYMAEKLWQKLDMQYDASWSIDSKKGDTEKAYCCLNARAIDYAKIGKMMYDNGAWQGEQIVPEAWIEATLKGAPNSNKYANQWWLLNSADKEYMAQGILGQYVYVNPAQNITIVRTGKNWGDMHWGGLFMQISDMIE